jgi:hypothetical protein
MEPVQQNPNPGIPDELRGELSGGADETSVEEQKPSDEANQDEGTAGEGIKPDKEEVDYKDKFINSSKEALRLLDEKKSLQDKVRELESYKTKLEEVQEQELKELEKVDPDAAKSLRMERELQQIKQESLINKRERELDKFIASDPDTAPDREALKMLMAVNPSKSLEELDSLLLKPIRDRVAVESIDKLHKQKASQVEKGKGSQTPEPVSTGLPDDFNAWPVDKRKAYLKKQGL